MSGDKQDDLMQEMIEALERSIAANVAALAAVQVEHAKIAKLRAALQYVCEEDYNILPRANSECRAHARRVLDETA